MKSDTFITGGRHLALFSLMRFEENGDTAEEALDTVCSGADPRERALAHELVLGVLRWRSRLDFLIDHMMGSPRKKLPTIPRQILRLGIYQLRYLPRIPPRAVVHEAVETCRRVKQEWAAGLINALLRRYDRERDVLEKAPDGTSVKSLSCRYAHPGWMVEHLLQAGEVDLPGLLLANNQIPPLTLRANTLVTSREALMQALGAAGVEARPTRFAPDGVVIARSGNITSLPGFHQGWFAVQDEASQMVSILLGANAGEDILNACAAPGGKATHLMALTGGAGRVVATDSSRSRLVQLVEASDRLTGGRLVARVVDWLQPPERSLEPRVFDRILLDAPCSGLGVVRRLPEIKWRRVPEDIARQADRQGRLLEGLAGRLKPGGTLVYSVCSLHRREGPEVVSNFLLSHPDCARVDLRQVLEPDLWSLLDQDGSLAMRPHHHDSDGFYAARITRLSSSAG